MSQHTKTVLVIDEHEASRDNLTGLLKRDYRVLRVSSGEAAFPILSREQIDLVLADVQMPGISGFDFLRIVKENYPLIEVIMASDNVDLEAAVQAMKSGAHHFVAKPCAPDQLRALLRTASEQQDANRKAAEQLAQIHDQTEREFIVGSSRSILEIVDVVQKVAKLPATILILGESGTGKELLARLVHREAGVPEAPFVAVNLPAIPRELTESLLFGHERGAFTGALRQQVGKFELAANGTLFLDEIGDLRLELQAKLLRAIQEGEIERVGGAKPIRTNFRLIAATNLDLDKAVKEGRFRADLYYRINVIPVRMPPLRERAEDIPQLSEFFLRRYNTRFGKNVQGFTSQVMAIFRRHRWPGNIRELENLVERLVAVNERDFIAEDDLPAEFQQVQPDLGDRRGGLLEDATSTFERNFIIRALETCGWNVTSTAQYIGVPLSTLKYKMDKLSVREFAKRQRNS